MHSKIKGGIGVSKAVSYFLEREIPCFVEAYCDLSDVDLIIEAKGGLKTAQVRTTEEKSGCAKLSLRSITPGTRQSACKVKRLGRDIDLFILYIRNKDLLLFVDGKEIKNFNNSVTFRLETARNNQANGCRNYKAYTRPSFL